MGKKISVIIPCYNASDYIDRCLLSLERQTIGFDVLEVICVDDASTDQTRDILVSWENRYPENIVLIPLDENGGQGHARNTALQYASCEWVAYLDADDWLETDCFECLFHASSEEACDIISGGLQRDPSKILSAFDASERPFKVPQTVYHVATDAERKAFFHSYPLPYTACGRLIRKSFLVENNILFPEGLAYEDTFFGALCSAYASKVRIVNENLYHYYVNEESTVLKMDAPYHPDLLTVQELLWREYDKRGFLKRFPDEMQYEYIITCCLAFWKIIVLRYHEAPYALYRLLCVTAQDKIKGYENNPYVLAGELREHYQLMIRGLLTPLTKTQFATFVANIRQIGL